MEANRSDECWYVRLDDVPRAVKFPFPLKELGFFWNKVGPEASFDWKLEFTIRLSSLERYAVDEIGGVTYRTEYPNAVLKLPGVVHRYAIPEPRDAVYFAYSIDLADAMAAANLFQMPPVWKIELTPKICEMLERAKQLMEHSREYGVADRLDLLAFQLYEELLFSRRENSGSRDRFMESRIQRIASYFQLNCKENIDLEALCRKNGLSIRTFFRHWKLYFDLSPGRYLLDLRLCDAARQLRETRKRISEIAESLNFQDTLYFSSRFRRKFGMTPLQYRKQVHAGLSKP